MPRGTRIDKENVLHWLDAIETSVMRTKECVRIEDFETGLIWAETLRRQVLTIKGILSKGQDDES